MTHLDDHLDTPTTEGAGAVVWALVAYVSVTVCALAGLALWLVKR